MKKFLIKRIPLFIIMGIINIALIVLSNVHIKIDITTPANITEVKSVIQVENSYEAKGTFNTTSVYSIPRASILQVALSKLSNSTINSKSSEYVNLSSVKNSNSGEIQKNISITNSIIVAYKSLGLHIDYTYEGIIIHTLATYAPDDLHVGDVINKVAGISFNNESEFLKIYNEERIKEEYFDLNSNSWKIPFTINNNDVVLETRTYVESNNIKYPLYGFYYYDYYKIDYETIEPKVKILNTNTGGPSGGLMQTLAIYNQLTEFDYTYGLTIAGTGTIDIDGSVGQIGGMYSKIFTAYYNKVDIFFVPYYENDDNENYEDALRAYKALGSPKSLKIVKVSSFSDAINYLKSLGE